MKVIDQTANRLVLRHLPIRAWGLSGAIVATVALLGSLLISGGQKTTLTCRRSAPQVGTCHLLVGVPGREPLDDRTLALTDVQRAVVQVIPPTAENRLSQQAYTIVLITRQGEFAFQSLQNDRAQADTAAEQTNQFLRNPSQSEITITYRYNTLNFFSRDGIGLLAILIPLCLLLLLIVFSAESQILTYTFDRIEGTLRIRAQGFLGATTQQIALEELAPLMAENAYQGLPLILPNSPIAVSGGIYMKLDLKSQVALQTFFESLPSKST